MLVTSNEIATVFFTETETNISVTTFTPPVETQFETTIVTKASVPDPVTTTEVCFHLPDWHLHEQESSWTPQHLCSNYGECPIFFKLHASIRQAVNIATVTDTFTRVSFTTTTKVENVTLAATMIIRPTTTTSYSVDTVTIAVSTIARPTTLTI